MASAAMMATYEKALERAHNDGLVIIGRGARKSDSAHVVYVSGKTASAYEVAVFATHMECNCPAHGYCKHRALVREDLEVRRAAEMAATAKAAADDLEKWTDRHCGVCGDLLTPRRRCPNGHGEEPSPKWVEARGFTDTRPITIWK